MVGDLRRVLNAPALSPDGQRVAFYGGVSGNPDIWLLETTRGAISRFTTDAADDVTPIWSPTGDRIVFSSNRTGTHALYTKAVIAGGGEQLLLARPEAIHATDWSSDGRFLLFFSAHQQTGMDVWAVPASGTEAAFPVVQTNYDEQYASFSPDGKWIAYQSNESGRVEIYLQSFPRPGNKWPVSTGGGTQVRWRADGSEIFYLGLDEQLMAVPVRLTSVHAGHWHAGGALCAAAWQRGAARRLPPAVHGRRQWPALPGGTGAGGDEPADHRHSQLARRIQVARRFDCRPALGAIAAGRLTGCGDQTLSATSQRMFVSSTGGSMRAHARPAVVAGPRGLRPVTVPAVPYNAGTVCRCPVNIWGRMKSSLLWRGGMGEVLSSSRYEAQARRRVENAARVASPTIPIGWRGSSARRRCSPRSITRTSRRSTASKSDRRPALVMELVEGADARRSARRGRCRWTKHCRSHGRLPRRSKPRTSKASSIAI